MDLLYYRPDIKKSYEHLVRMRNCPLVHYGHRQDSINYLVKKKFIEEIVLQTDSGYSVFRYRVTIAGLFFMFCYTHRRVSRSRCEKILAF